MHEQQQIKHSHSPSHLKSKNHPNLDQFYAFKDLFSKFAVFIWKTDEFCGNTSSQWLNIKSKTNFDCFSVLFLHINRIKSCSNGVKISLVGCKIFARAFDRTIIVRVSQKRIQVRINVKLYLLKTLSWNQNICSIK